ncbi:MAG: hypothetical protein WBJ84_04220 [Bacteroidales bacterium]
MTVVVSEVKSRRDYSEFIHLPEKIHRGHEQWVPPVWNDERAFFNPSKNIAFQHCDTILLLARRNSEVVGRIMGIIHRSYNQLHNESNVRFGFLECYDDQETAHALLQAVENWGRSKGMTRIIGPYGFSDKDPQGLLVEGFEHLAMIASNCNYPYLVKLVENEGYSKEIDCFAFRLPMDFKLPEKHRLIYERVQKSTRYKILEFTSRWQLKPYIVPILRVMNKCYQDIYGFIPMEEKEMKEFANRYLPILDPKFVKVATLQEEVIGFVVGLPNISRGLQKSGGYLWPFGLFHILRAMKKTKQIDLMLGGVKPGYQGLGLDLLMGFKLVDSAKAAGFEQIEVHLILETNYKMLAEVLRLNADPHKRFRVFQKAL